MRRELQYRAWDNVKDRMYYLGEEDDVVFSFDSNGIVAMDITEDEEEFKHLHHLQYMQYTGIKDENGNEIYEGDIVQSHDELLYSVVWHEKDAMFYYKDSYGDEDDDLLMRAVSFEVIGNAFENPELLLGGKGE
ncbi:YopX family protein [Bacillus mycoides]